MVHKMSGVMSLLTELITGAHIRRSLIMTARDQISPKNFDHSVHLYSIFQEKR